MNEARQVGLDQRIPFRAYSMRKDSSFKVVQSGTLQSKSKYRSYDIVFVDPFGSRSDLQYFRIAFKQLFERLSRENAKLDSARIYRFSFLSTALTSGKLSLKDLSQRLLAKLGRYRNITNATNRKSSEGVFSKEDDFSNRPFLIFVTHSLGLWVVKNAISQNGDYDVPFNTAGIVLLDAPLIYGDDYDKVISKLSEDVFSDSGKESMISTRAFMLLSQELKTADMNYGKLNNTWFAKQRRSFGLPEDIIQFSCTVWSDLLVESDERNNEDIRLPNWKFQRKAKGMRKRRDQASIREALFKAGLGEMITQIISRSELGYLPQGERIPPGQQLSPGDSPANIVEHDEDQLDNTNVRDFAPIARSPPSIIRGLPGVLQNVQETDAGSIASEVERASLLSTPNTRTAFGPNENSHPEMDRSIDLAKSFMKRGDFATAGFALRRSEAILKGLQLQEMSPYHFEVKALFAGLKLYCGKYQNACQDFQKLLPRIGEGETEDEVRADLNRWIAISLLHQGKCDEAASKLQDLLPPDDAVMRSEKPTAEIQVRRDLAFARACLGDYTEALNQLEKALALSGISKGYALRQISTEETISGFVDGDQPPHQRISDDTRDSRITIAAAGKRDILYLTWARISLIWGDYKQGLALSRHALEAITEHWGSKNMRTLECSSLYAMLPTLNSHVGEGQKICAATIDTMRTELGADHPITLEAMANLMRIYKIQWRLVEAVDTTRSLVETAETALGNEQIQTLDLICLLAELEISIGNYSTALIHLKRVEQMVSVHYKASKPEALRYKALRALSLYHCGAAEEAESLAFEVLRMQRKLYLVGATAEKQQTTGQRAVKSTLPPKPNTVEPAGKALLIDVMGLIGSCDKSASVHPSLLLTLRLLGLLGQQKLGAQDLQLSHQLFQTIWDRNRLADESSMLVALESEFDLAVSFRESVSSDEDDSVLERAAYHMQDVYWKQLDVLGYQHPSVVTSRRELLILNCTINKWEDTSDVRRPRQNGDGDTKPQFTDNMNAKEWAEVETTASEILQSHEGQLGVSHPETLKSLLWVFTVQILLGKEDELMKTLHTALERLRHPSVRGQRIVESLYLEYKFATILSDSDLSNESTQYELHALEILRNISEQIQQLLEALPKEEIPVTAKDVFTLSHNTEQDILRVSEAAVAQGEVLVAELEEQINDYGGGRGHELDQCHRYKLKKLLLTMYGADDPRTIEAEKKLIETEPDKDCVKKEKKVSGHQQQRITHLTTGVGAALDCHDNQI